MAWRSSGKTNVQLVSNMKSNGLIKSERIITVSFFGNAALGFFYPPVILLHRQ